MILLLSWEQSTAGFPWLHPSATLVALLGFGHHFVEAVADGRQH